MAVFSRKLCFLSALLVFASATGVVRADSADSDDEASVEVEEDDQYISPKLSSKGSVYLAEHFDNLKSFKQRWVQSEAKKQGVDENIAKYDGKWEIQAPSRKILKNDLGLVLVTEAKHAAISTLLDKPFEFKDKPLIVQYEVTMQEGQNCGGAYIKLLSKSTDTKADLRKFFDQTPYTIMFGPDKCGNDNKLHFIFRHKNPMNGTVEEKHSKKPSQRLDDIYKDKEPHLYTLIVRPDNTFTVLIDNKEVNSGSLLEDFTPPVNPPEEVDDPNDRKPDDWDEREKIVDPTATKPEDWDENAPAQIIDPNAVKPDGWLDDEPEMISDPDAKKPSDWDDDMDGEWEAPLIDNPVCSSAPGCGQWIPPTIPNPNYKGIWRAPLVPNPNYKGKWTPRRIQNPQYFKDDHPFKMTPIHAVGFELWSMSPQLLFDNVLITDDVVVAEQWATQTFAIKRAKLSKDSDSVLERGLKYAGENPWVYAVVIIGSFMFVALVAYMCCGPKSDSDADIKKTDAVVEDDPHQSEGEIDGEEADAENTQHIQEKSTSKADLEKSEQESTETEELDVADNETNDDTTPLVGSVGAGDGDVQRKRKPRKE